MKRALLAVLAACSLAPAAAMTLVTQGDTVFATGPVLDDLRQFEAALAQPGITTVAFVNSPGGSLWTGLRVGQLIASKGLDTVAAGQCMSACSIMFMGGRERRYADNFHPRLTMIGLHGAHRADTRQVESAAQPQLYAFYKARIGERFQTDIINRALYEMDDAGAFLRVPDPVREPGRLRPTHCRSAQTPPAQCTVFRQHNAVTLGIATHAELVTLQLPESFQAPPQLLGRALPDPVPDLEQAMAAQLELQCNTDACKELNGRWDSLKEHKALAAPVAEPGYGYAHDQESAERALAAAVYACNHPRGKPARLCEGRILDRYAIATLYASAEQEHAAALARLRPPPQEFYAGEEFGGAFTSAERLRTQQYIDMTPSGLPGIPTVGTQALALLLLAGPGPVLIDVSGARDTLPGARALVYGGQAYDAAERDQAYQRRFAALLALLAPDPTAPVVFLGASRQSWLPVNAALRARQLGYTQAMWYRGGLESWKAARLPTAPMLLRAVAN
ncbi:MAG: hypothetical protein RJA36_1019 [Pseudomonadota bacterium]|jgi:rhodanese-related sulfurtransferase